MKRLTLFIATLCAVFPVGANNKSTTLEQVTTVMELTDDVDLHITSTTPFTAEGAIDITNKEHAVIIFDNLKPSLASKQLKYIKIDGKAAKDGTNCQFRIYNRGAILLPYGKEGTTGSSFHPLTVYSEQNLQGDSCNLFGLENSNGYMNTLSKTKLSKRIRSFRLKRGYMVTFSIKAGGYGYSRCFIADQADLVFKTLPAILDKRIASYRVFRWQNTGKAGLGSDTRAEANAALNSISCYDWGTGVNLLPDVECVPNHIYEDWPSSAACGGVTYSCHMKTNNEPGNSADDHPQTVQEILNNWMNLMRTGMRLCSPSSHDGSLNHLRATLDSIDARGWRCDIIDLHCYWPEGSFSTGNFYDQWANRYGRPIWISEWVWGASWNSNGAFANGVTEAQNADAVKRITEKLNGWNCIERYFYWNSERDPSKIYKNGKLTKAGEYYASMNTGIGYCNYKNYVPKTPPVYAPSKLTASYIKRTGTVTLKWSNPNDGLTDLAIIQHKVNGRWVNVDTLISESASLTFTCTMNDKEMLGLQTFRIADVDFDGKTRISNEATFFNGEATDIAELKVGNIILDNTTATSIYFTDQEQAPAVFCGLISNRNTANAVLNNVRSVSKNLFTYQLNPWTLGKDMTIKNAETIHYLLAQPGQYTWGSMRAEVDTCLFINSKGQSAYRSKGDTCQVRFRQPFPEGVTPVVIVQNISSQAGLPTVAKVFDVTPEGFSFKLMAQTTATTAMQEQLCYYIAITPGSAPLADSGYFIHAGISTEPTGGVASIDHYFIGQQGDTLQLIEPWVIAGGQTHFLDVPSVFRKASDITITTSTDTEAEATRIIGMKVRRQVDPTASIPSGMNTAAKTGDHIGWIAIDLDPKLTDAPPVVVTAESYTIEYGDALPTFGFTSSGATLLGTPSISCEVTSASPVGTYPIVISKGSVTNYNDRYVNGTLTIKKAPLTIAANDCEREYGESTPGFTVSYAGFKNDETAEVLGMLPTLDCEGRNVGEYPIVVSGAEAQNYQISYVNGTLTITKAPLMVMAKDATRYEGDVNPPLELTYSGWKLDDDESVLTEMPVAVTAADEGSKPGSYEIIVTGGEADNYVITHVNGTLTVLPLPTSEFLADGMRFLVTDAVEHIVTLIKQNNGIQHMVIPSTVTAAVGGSEFTWTVTSLADSVFVGCEQLVTVEIPATITAVGKDVFSGCPHLAAITWKAPVKMTRTMVGDLENPNLLLYMEDKTNALENVTNVIDLNNMMAERIVLKDDEGTNDFYCPLAFTANEISYTHEYGQETKSGSSQGWDALTLPFDVVRVEHSQKGEIHPFSTLTLQQIIDGEKPFWLYAFTSKGFEEADAIHANTPYIISMPNEKDLWDNYILKGQVSFRATNAKVYATSEASSVQGNNKTFTPNYRKETSDDYFLLNVSDKYNSHAEGSVFAKGRRGTHPFEAYFTTIADVKEFGVFDEVASGIRDNSQFIIYHSQMDGAVYDMQGRIIVNGKLSKGKLPKGLYIINGKKVSVK